MTVTTTRTAPTVTETTASQPSMTATTTKADGQDIQESVDTEYDTEDDNGAENEP